MPDSAVTGSACGFYAKTFDVQLRREMNLDCERPGPGFFTEAKKQHRRFRRRVLRLLVVQFGYKLLSFFEFQAQVTDEFTSANHLLAFV